MRLLQIREEGVATVACGENDLEFNPMNLPFSLHKY